MPCANQKKVEFTKRPAGRMPVIVSTYAYGQALKDKLVDGDSASLRIGSETVQVNEINVLGNGKFRGRIHGFEPSFSLAYEGYKVDESVEFEEEHVWGLG
jgi:hypothetical protein